MRYWWVNQNQTYRAEVRGSFMWSPKRNANGARNQFYENMRQVSPGDVVFSFCDTRIKAIGVVTGAAQTGPKPDFGAAGANWAREVAGRLERIERLLPDEVVTDGKNGLPAILAWKGEPSLEVECTPEGELKLNAVKVAAWQAINLPRVWDNPEREPDEHPRSQLVAMFKRVRSALNAWMEAVDHLGHLPLPAK